MCTGAMDQEDNVSIVEPNEETLRRAMWDLGERTALGDPRSHARRRAELPHLDFPLGEFRDELVRRPLTCGVAAKGNNAK